ncbi:hypothetical protein CHCC5027_3561 [Bacillus paralicheniformis]|uniref:hypothetical protein n=1 Tax=Bacillus paralicheniformis TaxID=1648923 RepID=UPI001329E1AD|nr:hypothetical protein [Bacillus paralicheniformis]TWJ39648.1 hypothetical protein CHCC5027_3561 [Bacillus paralicheniformis]
MKLKNVRSFAIRILPDNVTIEPGAMFETSDKKMIKFLKESGFQEVKHRKESDK